MGNSSKEHSMDGLPWQQSRGQRSFLHLRGGLGAGRQAQSELLGVSMHPAGSAHCSLGPTAPQLGFPGAPNQGSTLHLGVHSPPRPPRQTLSLRHAFLAEVGRVQSNPKGPCVLPVPHRSFAAPAGEASQPLQRVICGDSHPRRSQSKGQSVSARPQARHPTRERAAAKRPSWLTCREEKRVPGSWL